MAKRRRNEDGSLVTPLSPAQEAALEKGRRALAAKLAGAPAPAPADKGAGPAHKGKPRVEKVAGVSKARKPRAKAPAGAERPPRARSKAPEPETKEPGLVERVAGWLSST